jgi:hypothetical protein
MRSSAARAWAIQRSEVGNRGRQKRNPATSHPLTAPSSGPHASPYSARMRAGRSPTAGHSVHE